jgi:hypothetical protein
MQAEVMDTSCACGILDRDIHLACLVTQKVGSEEHCYSQAACTYMYRIRRRGGDVVGGQRKVVSRGT